MAPFNESFSNGFNAGNYGNAYESQDWDSWYEEHGPDAEESDDPQSYRRGMMLGFFSSYEINEISDLEIAEEVERLRTMYPDA